jgi:hypothetical protein
MFHEETSSFHEDEDHARGFRPSETSREPRPPDRIWDDRFDQRRPRHERELRASCDCLMDVDSRFQEQTTDDYSAHPCTTFLDRAAKEKRKREEGQPTEPQEERDKARIEREPVSRSDTMRGQRMILIASR